MSETLEHLEQAHARRFRPYPRYTDSGVEWLGEIPAHWEIRALKRMFKVVNGSTPKSGEPDYWDGDIPWVTPDDLGKLQARVLTEPARYVSRKGYESCGTRMVPSGSLILSTRAPIGHLAIAGMAACTNQGCRSLVFHHQQNEIYFYFQVAAARAVLQALGRGSTFTELGKEDLEAVVLTLPPQEEQRAVATFLDRETAKIDGLVARKERLIELLQEKRTALITRAVTRGLDPNVPLKDSGVEWLGEIPAHWDVPKMWQISRAVSGGTPSKGERAYWYGEIPWVSPKDMKRRFIDSSEDRITERAVAETGIKLVDPPVMLIVVRGMILAHSFPVAITTVPVTINQDMKAVSFSSAIDPLFMVWVFEGVGKAVLAAIVEEAAHGTKAVRMDEWRSVTVPLPGADEQRTISAFLDRETAKIDSLVAKIRDAIDRLKEFRTALISDAVTGRIDVREDAA